MNKKQWRDAWRLLGYIEGANDTGVDGIAHDIIQGAVDALAEILLEIVPEEKKK